MIDFKLILIFIVLTCIIGCNTFNPSKNITWDTPVKPVDRPVRFVRTGDGLYMDKGSSINLLMNIDGTDTYVEKMEALVKEMKSYYGVK